MLSNKEFLFKAQSQAPRIKDLKSFIIEQNKNSKCEEEIVCFYKNTTEPLDDNEIIDKERVVKIQRFPKMACHPSAGVTRLEPVERGPKERKEEKSTPVEDSLLVEAGKDQLLTLYGNGKFRHRRERSFYQRKRKRLSAQAQPKERATSSRC